MHVLLNEKLYTRIIENQNLKEVKNNWEIKNKIDEEVSDMQLSTGQLNDVYFQVAYRLKLYSGGFFIPRDKMEEISDLLNDNKIWHARQVEDGGKAYFEIYNLKELSKAEILVEKKLGGSFD